MNISGAAVAKFAPNKDEAVKLITFMTSDAAQALHGRHELRVPDPHERCPTARLRSSSARSSPTALSLAAIAKNRKTASELVDQTGFDN